MGNSMDRVKNWYNDSYLNFGLAAQRRYPNEEMLRFLGRNLFGMPSELRKETHVLEVGCGSCANLWVVAKEGFDAHGIDLSPLSIELGKQMLDSWGVSADLKVASMTKLPYGDASFDIILDIFSSYCLNEEGFNLFLVEIKRVLKAGAKFFSYFPSKASDAFLNHSPSELLDTSTLNGIYRKDSPFSGNHYPFRFMHPEECKNVLNKHGFKVDYLETVTRSYRSMGEQFQHIVVEASKK
jgi:ubiquinone/menaquinone biosynthesis C-methylase UbiE